MATLYSPEMQRLVNNDAGGIPMQLPKAAYINGKERVQTAVITLASQAIGDVIHLFRVPKAAVILGFSHVTDTSLGVATVAIGNIHAGNSAIYKAAAVFTAIDTPTAFGKAAKIGYDLATGTCYSIEDKDSLYEDIILTIAAAAFPASGRYVVTCRYAVE